MPVTERQLAAFRHDHESTILHSTSPRHLAGPGDARHVTHALLTAGWTITSDPASPETEVTSPDLQARLQAAPQFAPSGNWWRLTVQPPNSRAWSARFTRRIPAEILAGLTDTLLIPAPADAPEPWDVVRATDWKITQSENGTGFEARSPDQRAVAEYSHLNNDVPLSSFFWRVRTREYPAGAAESAFDGRSVWDGWLDGHAPAHAIAGFVTALTSPEPLMRGWGQQGWHHNVQHERTSRTGRDVADAHEQRLKHIQAQVRAARRRQRLDTAPSAAPGGPVTASAARTR